MSLDGKLFNIKDGLSLVESNIANNVNESFSAINQKLTYLETKDNKLLFNLTQASLASACQDSIDLATFINGKFDILQNNILEKLYGFSAHMNVTAAETHSLIDAQSFLINATFGLDLQTVLTDFRTPKGCYKHMLYSITSSSTRYKVIEPNQANRLTTPVLCDSFSDGGGWVVFQRRLFGNLTFYRDWQEYKDGFGSLDGDFWLGNDNINALTNDGVYELRIDMKFNGMFAYAHYDSFSVEGEATNYVLHVSGYSGTAGDSLNPHHNGMPFSTPDKDNDNWSNNCAVSYVGAWWYNVCHNSNLNGQWGSGDNKGPAWQEFTGTNAVTYSEMKFRRLT